MALTQATISQQMQWALSGTAVGSFAAPTQGSDAITLAANPAVATWNQIFVQQYSILHGTTQSFDLTSFTNLVGVSGLAFTKVLAMIISVSGTGTNIQWKPSTSNGLIWPVADVTDKIELQDGGTFSYAMAVSGTGKVVDATHKSIDLINSAGSGTAIVKVAIIGSTL